jgi:hypothetical protein
MSLDTIIVVKILYVVLQRLTRSKLIDQFRMVHFRDRSDEGLVHMWCTEGASKAILIWSQKDLLMMSQ